MNVIILSVFQGSRPLHVAQCHQSEADVLHCNSVAPDNGYVSEENKLFVFSQTPKGYYNQPLKKYTPPPLTLPSTTLPSQAGLPSSPFRSAVTNLSYNLIMPTGDQQSISGPELQEGRPLERSSGGYQPYSSPESFTVNETTEDPDSPMSCVTTYILLPQSTAE